MNQDLCDLIAVYNACQNKWLKGELGKLLVQAVGSWVNGPDLRLTADEACLVYAGKKIPAIKAFKDRTGCTLLEAKNAVENSVEYKDNLQRVRQAEHDAAIRGF